MDDEIFRERLKQLRLNQHKQAEVVSELCGLPTDSIRRYEKGECKPSFTSLILIADYFEVSIDYLTGRSDSKEIPL